MQTATAHEPAVHNLGSVHRVPLGEGRTYLVGEQPVTVFHTRDGRVFATQATCPHKQGPLADGLVGGSTVVCPLHGFKFDLETGRPKGNDCRSLVTYPVSVSEAGDIILSIGA
jgi:nitrite reductase (NADH) small subunit